MSNIFRGQGYAYIELDTGEDLATVNDLKILAQKPDKSKVEYTGTVSNTTMVKYEFANGDLDLAGIWRFQAYFTVAGRKCYGDIVMEEIMEPIKQVT